MPEWAKVMFPEHDQDVPRPRVVQGQHLPRIKQYVDAFGQDCLEKYGIIPSASFDQAHYTKDTEERETEMNLARQAMTFAFDREQVDPEQRGQLKYELIARAYLSELQVETRRLRHTWMNGFSRELPDSAITLQKDPTLLPNKGGQGRYPRPLGAGVDCVVEIAAMYANALTGAYRGPHSGMLRASHILDAGGMRGYGATMQHDTAGIMKRLELLGQTSGGRIKVMPTVGMGFDEIERRIFGPYRLVAPKVRCGLAVLYDSDTTLLSNHFAGVLSARDGKIALTDHAHARGFNMNGREFLERWAATNMTAVAVMAVPKR